MFVVVQMQISNTRSSIKSTWTFIYLDHSIPQYRKSIYFEKGPVIILKLHYINLKCVVTIKATKQALAATASDGWTQTAPMNMSKTTYHTYEIKINIYYQYKI